MKFQNISLLLLLISFVILVLFQKNGSISSSFGMLLGAFISVYTYANGLQVYFIQNRRFTGCFVLFISFIMFLLLYSDGYSNYEFNTIDGVRNITTGEAFYFSIITVTTLGYGDISPRGDIRYIAASQALLGYLYLGTFIGILLDYGTYFRNLTTKTKDLEENHLNRKTDENPNDAK